MAIAGVDVSIRPDAYIKNDNDEVIGALKLHFPKSALWIKIQENMLQLL